MERKICIVLLITLALLNVYDTFSTNTLLTRGEEFYEFNPAMRFAMDKIGLVPTMVIVKGILLLWFLSFIFRASTKREWNILTVGLIVANSYYAIGMYFMNHQAMLSLSGGT